MTEPDDTRHSGQDKVESHGRSNAKGYFCNRQRALHPEGLSYPHEGHHVSLEHRAPLLVSPLSALQPAWTLDIHAFMHKRS